LGYFEEELTYLRHDRAMRFSGKSITDDVFAWFGETPKQQLRPEDILLSLMAAIRCELLRQTPAKHLYGDFRVSGIGFVSKALFSRDE